MLNGIDPIIIFQIRRKVPQQAASTVVVPLAPIAAHDSTYIEEPPIPIYLSESLGVLIEAEDKNVDIDTDLQTKSDGTPAEAHQKGVASITSINIIGNKNSIGLTLLSAMIDLIFDKVTSNEYKITYIHGPITVFRGLINSFSVNQNSGDDRLLMKIDISRGTKQPDKPADVVVVPKLVGAKPL